AGYAKRAVQTGADGLFYATNVARRDLLSPAECRRFQRPWDLRVLDAVAAAPFNVLHVCGTAAHLDEFVDYPAHDAGIDVTATCGGRGRCTSCRVKFVAGAVPPPTIGDEVQL